MNQTRQAMFIFLTLLAFSIFVSSTSAVEDQGTVNLSDFPQQLADRLTIDLFPAQLLSSTIFMCLFMFPSMLLAGKDNAIFAMLITGIPTMGFCIAMTWLPYWFLIILSMMVALMFSGKMRDWISGSGD